MALRLLTLDYRVALGLDGSTDAPPFSAGRTDPITQALVFEVDRLGLVDLTGLGRVPLGLGSNADRILPWFYMVGPFPRFIGNNVQLGVEGIASKVLIDLPVGAQGIYTEQCLRVPQGQQLLLVGLDGDPGGDPVRVLMRVWVASDEATWGEMVRYCCCANAAVDEVGDPLLANAIYNQATCQRVITSTSPESVSVDTGIVPVSIIGSNFSDGDQVFFVHQDDPTRTISVTTVTFIDPTQIDVEIETAGADLGNYDLVVAPPLASEICGGTLEDFVVNP